MKIRIISLILLLSAAGYKATAQSEKYGNTLNLGAGIGYYNYYDHSIPVIGLNYEIDVARNFTLAPFIAYYSYSNYVYWGTRIILIPIIITMNPLCP